MPRFVIWPDLEMVARSPVAEVRVRLLNKPSRVKKKPLRF
jgi:hypothetical protein